MIDLWPNILWSQRRLATAVSLSRLSPRIWRGSLHGLGELVHMTNQQSTVERTFDLVKPSGEKIQFAMSYGPVYQRDQLFFLPCSFRRMGESAA